MNICSRTNSTGSKENRRRAGRKFRLRVSIVFVAIAAAMSTRNGGAATVTYDTAPYWPIVQGLFGGMSPSTPTVGETFIPPNGPSVTLRDFTFYAEPPAPPFAPTTLHLRSFVFAWSGNIYGPGGGAVGSALYLGPSFSFTPAPRPDQYTDVWTPLTATIGGDGLSLNPGQHYVMGFTMLDPADYAASHGAAFLQFVPARNPNYNPPPIPPGVDFGGGGAVWLNNTNDFGALNHSIWDTWGDIGVLSFTANFTVVPEPSAIVLVILGAGICARRLLKTRTQTA